jgi:hypothetical protein
MITVTPLRIRQQQKCYHTKFGDADGNENDSVISIDDYRETKEAKLRID